MSLFQSEETEDPGSVRNSQGLIAKTQKQGWLGFAVQKNVEQ